MMRKLRALTALALLAGQLLMILGCAHDATAPPPAPTQVAMTANNMPELGQPAKHGPGVIKYEIELPTGKPTNHVWIYLPDRRPKTKLPIILIAPAGSPMFRGMALAPADEVEHVPYAKAGFAVVAYDLDGDVGVVRPTTQQALAAARAFMDSHAGIDNEKDALNYTLAKVPNVDPTRIYMVGHSSAGAHALLATSQDSRIKACVAYAPVSRVRLNERTLNTLNTNIQGFSDFANWESPDSHMDALKCPILIFQAKDDEVVPVDMNIGFQKELAKSNKNTQIKLVDKGGHYQAMLDQGIPAAIKWLRNLK
jgi:dipeptidyl aminopeptidase/acylaminoacyl peptidase